MMMMMTGSERTQRKETILINTSGFRYLVSGFWLLASGRHLINANGGHSLILI